MAKINTFAGPANDHGLTKTQIMIVAMNYVTIETILIPFSLVVNSKKKVR